MKVVIIGNGVSGISAARHIRKQSNAEIIVISEEGPYFFSRTALMYIYMGHMREVDTQPYEPFFWKKNRIELLQTRVTSIDYTKKSLSLKDGKALHYDKLVLAVGSTPRPHPALPPLRSVKGICGMYHLQDLYHLEDVSPDVKHGTIIGGGLIGVELAEMLHARGKSVSLLVRENSYWNQVLPPEESAMVTKHILSHGIDLKCGTEMTDSKVENNKLVSITTNKGETIDSQFLGVSIGVVPNTAFLKDSGLEIGRGILINNYLETNMPDVYAIGDCAEMRTPAPGRRPIEAIWYTGKMMGEVAAYNITGNKIEYDPGIWFNSAKFFDIEYQVYGDVQAKLKEDQATIYWQHPTLNKLIRIVFEKNTHEVQGFNLMGIRFRHEVCEKWIANKTSMEEVLTHLSLANFDPELTDVFDGELVKIYNKTYNKNVKLKTKRGLTAVLNFLRK